LNIPDIRPPRAWIAGRLARLGATRPLHHGLLASALLASVILAGPSRAAVARPPMPATLARHLQADGFTAADLAAIAAGRVVARPLHNAEKDESGAIGVVRIDLSPDVFLGRVRDITRFERGPGVPAVGRFGVPATVADLAGFTLPAEDARDLAGCAVDDCDLNLSFGQIDRFRRVDAREPGGRERLTAAAREGLVAITAEYQRRGNDALVVYRDRVPPIALRDASARLLKQAVELRRTAPAVATYLERYPAEALPAGAEEFFYWSVMTFGMKPITRANHVVVAPVETDGLAGFVAVSRTLYASHYFRDGLEVKHVVPASPERTSFYLVSVNRSHSESLTGVKGLLIGAKIRSSARSGVERHILHVKKQAEAPTP
jgi:hypothetical protein